MSEKQKRPFQLSFNASLRVGFRGSRVTSDGGLISGAEKKRNSGNWRYTVVAGEAAWKSQLECFFKDRRSLIADTAQYRISLRALSWRPALWVQGGPRGLHYSFT
jgi:hypothetical protein